MSDQISHSWEKWANYYMLEGITNELDSTRRLTTSDLCCHQEPESSVTTWVTKMALIKNSYTEPYCFQLTEGEYPGLVGDWLLYCGLVGE
jgi:hypothetical protein